MYFRHDEKRLGQDKLIYDMTFALENNLIGLFEAPTGLGKTDASLASALDFAIKNNKKLFFITPKNSQHKIVVEAIKEINEKYNSSHKVVDLVAKSNLCIDPFLYGLGTEFYELCEKKIMHQACLPYINAIGKGKDKHIMDLFLSNHSHALLSSEFREESMKYNVCPYVASLFIAKHAKVIVCDVNYIFVPKIRASLFKTLELKLEDCVFIFDEAHNLPSRLRTILSDNLSVKQIGYARKEWEKVNKKELYDISDFLESLEYMFTKQKEGFIEDSYFDKLFNDENIIDSLLSAGDFILENEKKKPYLFKIASFMSSWLTDKKVKTRFKSKDTISIKGLDPSFLSSEIFENCFGALLMSATFSPMNMYADILGIKNPYIREYISPFPRENKLVMYFDNVTTKYEERAKSIGDITNIILQTLNKVSGNVAVFFPSYDVLQTVYLRGSEKLIKKMYVQEKNMTMQEMKRLIDNFKKNKVGFGSVLFAVVGGSFSEGVDYPGDDLIGIIMVGFPFPEPDYEMESLIKFYDLQGKSGWNYAYLYPTVAKVVQACGRGIRSEKDMAFILLLDKRFGWTKYNSLFPKDYNILKYDQKKFVDFIKKI